MSKIIIFLGQYFLYNEKHLEEQKKERSAMAMLNVIKDSEVFEVTLNKIIENSDDAEQVEEAQAAKDVLAQEKAN